MGRSRRGRGSTAISLGTVALSTSIAAVPFALSSISVAFTLGYLARIAAISSGLGRRSRGRDLPTSCSFSSIGSASLIGRTVIADKPQPTDADIDDAVRTQIEEEIYDLFLWKKADFEFLIDFCPEEIKNPSHNVTELSFNTILLFNHVAQAIGILSDQVFGSGIRINSKLFQDFLTRR